MDYLDVWNVCIAYSDHFKWSEYDLLSEADGNYVKGAKDKSGKVGSKDSKSRASSKISKKSKQVPHFLKEDRDVRYHLVVSCKDMR